MTITLEAAFHEAGHAIAAHLSTYHAVGGDIDLGNFGSGHFSVSMSKKKTIAAGKSSDPSTAVLQECVEDLAVVLCAGFVAECVLAEKNNALVPDRGCSRIDYELLKERLAAGRLPQAHKKFEDNARIVLVEHWSVVEILASHLFEVKKMWGPDIIDFLEARVFSE